MKTNLAGLRCVIFARCSGDNNVLDGQVSGLRKFASERGMTVIAEDRLPNTSAADPAAEMAFERLIRRKMEDRDFEVLLVSDLSRLTRQGIADGLRLIRRFASVGISVVTPDFVHSGARIFTGLKKGVKKTKVRVTPNGKKNERRRAGGFSRNDSRGGKSVQGGRQ